MTNRIDATLAELRAKGKDILAPFVTLGYPDMATSEEMAVAIWRRERTCSNWAYRSVTRSLTGPTVQKTSFRRWRTGRPFVARLTAFENTKQGNQCSIDIHGLP